MTDLDINQVVWDCGLSVGREALPGGICAEMVFDVEPEGFANLITFNVALTRESDGSPIPISDEIMPLIQALIVYRLYDKKLGMQIEALDEACRRQRDSLRPRKMDRI